MGLLTKKVARSSVAFAGIVEYAESGDDGAPISAIVSVERLRDRIGGKEPLPMFGPLGAARLLSMLRREPHYVVPFMTLAASVSDDLLDEGTDLPNFAVRDSVVTDPEMLAAMVGSASELGGGFAEDSFHSAGLNSSLPVLVQELPGPQERTTDLELHEARNGAASVRFKFAMRDANALTTIGAWAATVECLVTTHPREAMAVPVGQGLKALGILWEAMEYPAGISVQQGSEVEAVVAQAVATNTPDGDKGRTAGQVF